MNVAQRGRTGWLAAGLALALIGATCAAHAQTKDTTELPRTYAFKFGTFMSNNGNLSGQASEWWWAGGIDWFPNLKTRPLRGDLHVDFDAKWRSTKLSDFHMLSVVGKLIWPITKPDSKIQAWGGLGGGIYFIDTAFIGSTVQPGAKFTLGIDLTKRIFIEADYDYVSGFTDNLGNSIRPDGFTFTAGYRF